MQRILVLNPKRGFGKTTIATNLASYFAGQGDRPVLQDNDPQASSIPLAQETQPDQPFIHGVAAFERNSRMDPCLADRIPRMQRMSCRHAGRGARPRNAGHDQECRRHHRAVLPSDIDIHACSKCIADLLLIAKVRRRRVSHRRGCQSRQNAIP